MVRLSLFKRSAIRRLLNVFVPSKVKWPERKKRKEKKKMNRSEKKSAMHRRYVDASANHSLSSFSFTLSLSHISLLSIPSSFLSQILLSYSLWNTHPLSKMKRLKSECLLNFSPSRCILLFCLDVLLLCSQTSIEILKDLTEWQTQVVKPISFRHLGIFFIGDPSQNSWERPLTLFGVREWGGAQNV